jgi:hypothetical protein
MERHQIRVPKYVDGWLAFDEPRCGFHGILVESKSGSQSFDAAIHQLKCYRATLRNRVPGRILVWGIVEQVDEDDAGDVLSKVQDETGRQASEDLWLFSDANSIPALLESIGLTSGVEACA